MESPHSKLFNKPGYISVKDYVEDIRYMQRNGPWKLPLGIGDRFHLFFLRIVARFSWFSNSLFLIYPYEWSPAYSVLVLYLRRKGILDEVVQKDSKYPGYFHFVAKKNTFINEHVAVLSSDGISRDPETALSKALGEIIERVITGLFDQNRKKITASPQEMLQKNRAIVYPPKHHRFLALQKESYRELEHNPSHSTDWMEGMNLVTHQKSYIPRQLTSWYGFGSDRIFHDYFLDHNSNGCAGYFTRTGAILRALLEGVNRDNFLVHWLTMIPPEKINIETLPDEMQYMINGFKARGIKLQILNVTALDIPSVYIVAINSQSLRPQIVLSGASALSFERAIGDALREMVQVAKMLDLPDDPKLIERLPTLKPFINNLNQRTRQLYWRGAEKVEKFQWFLGGKQVSYTEVCQRDLGSNKQSSGTQLEICLRSLKNRGSDYYPVVYFPEHFVQRAVRFSLAQVYIPKAFPLYLNECYGTFDSDRLKDFALSKGIHKWNLNTMPHMFS